MVSPKIPPAGSAGSAYIQAMEPDVRVDASGKHCPLPIFELARAVRALAPGAVVELVATDPGVEPDLLAWCEATGHELLDMQRKGRAWVARVRKAG